MFTRSFLTLVLASISLAAPLSRRAALDFGTCSDPTIKFANGLDGRNTAAFAPNNSADFNHGSALNIGVISSFICGQLQSACKASADAVAACDAGEQAAGSLTGQAAADAFNAAVTGGSTSAASADASATTAAVADAASSSAAAVDTGCVATVTVTVAATGAPVATASAADAIAESAAAATASPAATSPATASASGTNLQTFTGSLGGAPPPVVAGGKGFIVDGSEFINKAGALGRSCDVQHNQCADAANSGASFSVSDCDSQDTACKAAAN